MKVLIVDDETPILEMYNDKLTSEGFEVATAADGEEAIRKAEQLNPDVILLDILMPKINGLDVLKAFKSNDETKNIPVYVLTNIPEESVEKAHSLGAAGYLFKAITEPAKLANFLKKLDH